MAVFIAFFPALGVRSFEDGDITVNASINFQLQETSLKEGYLAEGVSIMVDLPSESWKIQDMELNFTEIDFEPEMKVIENNTIPNTFKRVYNKNPAQNLFGLSVQIELKEPSILYGVYIYGYNYLSHPGTPQIQLRGFDEINKNPNNTVFKSIALNIRHGWLVFSKLHRPRALNSRKL